jgi:hypothetical protein
MDEAFAFHAFAEPRLHEKVGCALFENAGANAFLDIRPAPPLHHDAFDALEVEKVGEEESRRPCPDDPDLSPDHH